MNASSMEKWVNILGAKQRCMDLESKYRTPFKTSDMIAKSYVTVETLEGMWAEAGKIREFQELDEELTALSARISRENESKPNNAKSFYRGTSIEELEDVLGRGGGISKGGRYKFTSLSTNLAVSMLFADSEGVVLVYGGDSVRKTGVSIPVKYSHKYSTRNEDIARGMSLAYMHQDETRIPDGTEGPVLTAAVIDSEKHLSPRMLSGKNGRGCRQARVRYTELSFGCVFDSSSLIHFGTSSVRAARLHHCVFCLPAGHVAPAHERVYCCGAVAKLQQPGCVECYAALRPA